MCVANGVNLEKAHQIGKGSYVASSNGGKIFVKLQPPMPRSGLRRFIRKLNGGSLAFENEQLIYNELTENEREALGVPRVIKCVLRECIVLEYLSSLREVFPTCSNTDLASLILQFNSLRINPNRPIWKRWQFWLLEAPICRTIRVAATLGVRYLGVWNTFRLVITVLVMHVLERSQGRSVLLHNDINPNNIVMSDDRRLRLIDFEDSIRENKWVLVDIVDASFNPMSLKFNVEILREYLSLGFQNGTLSSRLNLERQVRFALIRRVLLLLSFRRTPDVQKPVLAKFLVDILLEHNKFSHWFSEQGITVGKRGLRD